MRIGAKDHGGIRPMIRRSRGSAAVFAGGIAIVLMIGSWLAPNQARAQAQPPAETGGDVTIDTFSTEDAGAKVIYRGVAFGKTNFNIEDVQKLFALTVPGDQKLALVQKLKAETIAISSIEIEPPEHGVHVALNGLEATGVDAGKIGKLAIAGLEGFDKEDKIRVKSGALLVEDADFTQVLKAITGETTLPRARLSHLSLAGLDIVAPDRRGGEGAHHIAFDSFDIKNEYDGEVIKHGSTSLKGLVVEPAPGSELGDFLASLSYLQLELDAAMDVRYDAATKSFSLDQLSIDGRQMGSIVASASFANVDPALFTGDQKAILQAFLAAGAASAEIKFVNSGAVERALAFFAKERRLTPSAFRLQVAAATVEQAAVLLSPSSDALSAAIEAQKFIASPKTLVISVRAKGAPLRPIDFQDASDLHDILQRINISAVANPDKAAP